MCGLIRRSFNCFFGKLTENEEKSSEIPCRLVYIYNVSRKPNWCWVFFWLFSFLNNLHVLSIICMFANKAEKSPQQNWCKISINTIQLNAATVINVDFYWFKIFYKRKYFVNFVIKNTIFWYDHLLKKELIYELTYVMTIRTDIGAIMYTILYIKSWHQVMYRSL